MVDETLDLRELLSALYRRKGIIVLMVVVSVLTAYVASSRLPRIYEASTTLLVKDPRSSAKPFPKARPSRTSCKLRRTGPQPYYRGTAAAWDDWDVHDPEF